MANIQERRDKSGKLISYSIRVHRGRGADGKQLKPYTATFEVQPTWTEKSAKKKAEAFAATFEKACKEGTATDTRQKFAEYCDYVLELKEQRGVKHSTIVRYRELATRINPAIGHIKLKDLRADHLNAFYTELGKKGSAKSITTATAKIDLSALLKKKHITRVQLSENTGLPLRAVYSAVRGEQIKPAVAEAISTALEIKMADSFTLEEDSKTLSAKTIIEHHRLISTVLEQAVKDGLVPYNVASRATLPKAQQKEVNYFQLEDVAAIREALETEPIKWKTITHLLLITGARRGEILGLKWPSVDFENNRIYICNNVLYAADIGIYEDTPKTEKSKRYISLPAETMALLREYRAWQNEERLRLGGYFVNQGFVFCQDNGGPMHPDSVTDGLAKFSKRHGLPHINPHAFRHTMASMLYFNGVDSVSISKRLGHAQVSTTANIYAHVMEQADQKNADILADIFLSQKTANS
jgi:integrase